MDVIVCGHACDRIKRITRGDSHTFWNVQLRCDVVDTVDGSNEDPI